MANTVNRDDAGKIAHKLNECKNVLQKGNVFSCLLKFRDVLEKMLSTPMIPSDEKALQKEINEFQKALSENRNFLEIYGPVTFRDDEIAPALALMNQLIEIKNDEMTELLEEKEDEEAAVPEMVFHEEALQKEPHSEKTVQRDDDDEAQLNIVRVLLKNGDHEAAMELLKDKDELASLLVEEFNTAGIEYRRAGQHGEALQEFNRALVISPRDEGIYYNMARVYIDRGEWKTAAETINEGLKINHDFGPGIRLLKYIRETGFGGESHTDAEP